MGGATPINWSLPNNSNKHKFCNSIVHKITKCRAANKHSQHKRQRIPKEWCGRERTRVWYRRLRNKLVTMGGKEEGAPLPPTVTRLRTEAEERIEANLKILRRMRQKLLTPKRQKAANPMKRKGPTRRFDRRKKLKTMVRELWIVKKWGPANPSLALNHG